MDRGTVHLANRATLRSLLSPASARGELDEKAIKLLKHTLLSVHS